MPMSDTSNESSTPAVHGTNTAESGAGVFGQAEAKGAGGVIGHAHAVDGRGVYGESTDGTGVWGFSKAGRGVLGASEAEGGAGVFGQAEAKGAGGVIGHAHAVDGRGVYGESTDGTGVWGFSKAGRGVLGASEAEGGAGVFGQAEAKGAGGVIGHAHAVDGRGVYGESTDGTGVWGFSDNGPGVFGAGNPAGSFRGNVVIDGNVEVTGDLILAGADYAEALTAAEPALEVGTVVVINEEGEVEPCRREYDTAVAGVVSGGGGVRPGVVLDRHDSGVNVAMMGKVWCLADGDAAPIAPGDLLTTSATAGHARSIDDQERAFGAVIGKALTPLTEGRGLVRVLVCGR